MIHLRIVAVVAASVLGACGLISEDVTNFDLTLPDKTFTIDTAKWDVTPAEAQTYLQTSCASAPTVCNAAAQQACPMNCSGECNNTTQTCDLKLDVSLYQPIDLVMEKPELKSINDQPVIKVTVDSVTWEVRANSLSVDTPAMKVYVAPMSVMDPNDPQAIQIGTLDVIPAGMVTSGPQEIAFTADGKAALVSTMSTYKTPFNVIVGSALFVRSGQMVPAGKLDAVVHIKAHAGI
jgi:DNA-binding beta-propeller fold protein YncE